MSVILTSVLPFLAMIVVLIVIHELGHYITGKLAGVKVLEFGLGYPPRLFGCPSLLGEKGTRGKPTRLLRWPVLAFDDRCPLGVLTPSKLHA